MTRLLAQNESDEVRSALEDELASEAMNTEKLRVIVMLIIVGAGAVLSLVPPAYFFESVVPAFNGNVSAFAQWRFFILGALVLYLFAERLLLGHLIRRRRRIPAAYRYATAFIETSCPTAEIIVAASFTDSVSALSLTPVFIYPLFIVLSALRLNFKLSVFTGAVAAIEYLFVGMFYIERASGKSFNPIAMSGAIHLSKAITLLLLGVVTGLVALQIKKRILEAGEIAVERNNIVSMFGKHLSPVVVDQLLAQGAELPSEKKNVCVMFLDIRNFTSFAEKRSPEEVVNYLETLFEFMIEIVNRHHGIINKFLGDGFMAVFGAPLSDGGDCLNGVAAAQEILSRVKEEVAKGRVLPTTVGIGLHAGEAVTGSIGSSLRREYTVIGDVVNLASRIEQLNKRFGSQLLISEMVWQTLADGLTGAIPMGHVQVKGRETPIQIYQVA